MAARTKVTISIAKDSGDRLEALASLMGCTMSHLVEQGLARLLRELSEPQTRDLETSIRLRREREQGRGPWAPAGRQ